MAHYARVKNGIVTNVIVAEPEFFNSFIDTEPGEWIQTSYNTRAGVHYIPNTNIPSEDQSKALRKNFASVGFTYDAKLDAFIPPQPYPSWKLNMITFQWEPPIPYPEEQTTSGEGDQMNIWNESTKSWVKCESCTTQ